MGCWGNQDGVQMHGGIQTYEGCLDTPNIWGCQVNALKEVILNSFYFGRVWWS